MDAMVIDDSRVTRMLLGKLLTKAGFRVSEAQGGWEALAMLKANPQPRLALVDCNMPEMDGLAVVRAIRADPALEGTRLLMVSAEGETPVIQECLAAGAEGYLCKPCTSEVLEEKLTQLGIRVP
jgi:two-component system chemotaxis response regulator CheY